MRPFWLYLYRGETPSSVCLNDGTLLLRVVRASARSIAMVWIASFAFVPTRFTPAP